MFLLVKLKKRKKENHRKTTYPAKKKERKNKVEQLKIWWISCNDEKI